MRLQAPEGLGVSSVSVRGQTYLVENGFVDVGSGAAADELVADHGFTWAPDDGAGGAQADPNAITISADQAKAWLRRFGVALPDHASPRQIGDVLRQTLARAESPGGPAGNRKEDRPPLGGTDAGRSLSEGEPSFEEIEIWDDAKIREFLKSKGQTPPTNAKLETLKQRAREQLGVKSEDQKPGLVPGAPGPVRGPQG